MEIREEYKTEHRKLKDMMADGEKPVDTEFAMAEKTLLEDASSSAIAVLPQSSPVNDEKEFDQDSLKKKMPEIFAALFTDQQNLQSFRNFVSVSEPTTVPFTYQDLNGTQQRLDPTFLEEYKNALNFVHKVKKGGQKTYKGFSSMVRKCIEKHMSLSDAYCEVLVLFPDHKDLQEGVRRFMPLPDASHQDLDANQHGIEAAKKQFKQPLEENFKRAGSRRINEIKDPINFFQKVRTILSSREVALTFLKIVHAYNNGKIGIDELENRVEAIIGKYPNLMAEFNYYLRECHNIDGFSETENKSVNPALESDDEEIRYELDMLVHWYESASLYARELFNGNIDEDDKYGSVKAKRVRFQRCVERLYGDLAVDAIGAIYKNPKFAKPIILAHLEKTVEKLKDDRSYFNRKRT